MDPQETGKVTVHKRRKLLAIIAAVCILLVGAFIAWLCIDFHPHKSLEEMGAVTFPVEGESGIAGNQPGHPFTFCLEGDMPLQWNIKTNSGVFLYVDRNPITNGKIVKELDQTFTLSNGEIVFWSQYSNGYSTLAVDRKDRIYIEAILYAESHIVGYCVIELHVIDYGGSNSAKVLDSAYYPPQNGEYQNITMGHIRKQILKAKIFG